MTTFERTFVAPFLGSTNYPGYRYPAPALRPGRHRARGKHGFHRMPSNRGRITLRGMFYVARHRRAE